MYHRFTIATVSTVSSTSEISDLVRSLFRGALWYPAQARHEAARSSSCHGRRNEKHHVGGGGGTIWNHGARLDGPRDFRGKFESAEDHVRAIIRAGSEKEGRGSSQLSRGDKCSVCISALFILSSLVTSVGRYKKSGRQAMYGGRSNGGVGGRSERNSYGGGEEEQAGGDGRAGLGGEEGRPSSQEAPGEVLTAFDRRQSTAWSVAEHERGVNYFGRLSRARFHRYLTHSLTYTHTTHSSLELHHKCMTQHLMRALRSI